MKKIQTEDSKRRRNKLLVILVVFGLLYALTVHGFDREAMVRCEALKVQSEQFEGFFMSEAEKEMCQSIGVNVTVLYSPEVLADMKRSEEEKVARERTPEAVKQEPKNIYAERLEKELAYLKLHDELKKICACESTGNPNKIPQHYERDGITVLTGRITPADIGMCQINLDYHAHNAKRMGIDVYDPNGNVAYANWLYERQGNQPWSASKKCWQR